MTDASTDLRAQVKDFLTSRRARITPDKAGLPAYGANRRVPGLRREEVAMLAGMSIDYYTRLERGNLSGASESVLSSLAEALQLDEAERDHLFNLARASNTRPAARASRRTTSRAVIRPSVRRLLDSMTGTPAYVRNARMDILAANTMAFALYDGVLSPDNLPTNFVRYLFLDDAAPDFFVEWNKVAHDAVATLRGEAGRNPYDRKLTDLVGELATRSEEFRVLWAGQDVRHHRNATKRLRTTLAGEVQLTGDALELPGDGLTMITYTAEPNSPAQEELDFLASWVSRPVDARADTNS